MAKKKAARSNPEERKTTLTDLTPDQRSQIAPDVFNRFFKKKEGATAIARWITDELDLASEYAHHSVYPLLRQFVAQYARIEMPIERQLADNLCDKYRLDHDSIRVIDTEGSAQFFDDDTAAAEWKRSFRRERAQDLLHFLGDSAAEWLTRILKERENELTSKEDDFIHACFSSGATASAVARSLGKLFEFDERHPPIHIHACNSCFSTNEPMHSPSCFAGYFVKSPGPVRSTGLFSTPLVPAEPDAYKKLQDLPGIKEAFDGKDDISVMVTSVGDASHGDNHLRHALKSVPEPERQPEPPDWVGDLAYAPYTETNFILIESGYRAISIFELPELVKFAAAPNKVSMLVAGQNSRGETKHKALRPLLVHKQLKFWSHLVIDKPTARALLSDDMKPA